MHLILPPLKWNKTTDGVDVDAAASLRWAMEYERSLLPPSTIFPRPGQVWETVRDCEVGFEACMTYSGPKFTTVRFPNGRRVTMQAIGKRDVVLPFGTARLPKGERVRVVTRTGTAEFADPKPLYVLLQPLRYDELRESIVPQELRTASTYTGDRLCVSTARPEHWFGAKAACLNEDFRLIEDVD
jgi:hypothetical protein